jgi:hypothetical protein
VDWLLVAGRKMMDEKVKKKTAGMGLFFDCWSIPSGLRNSPDVILRVLPEPD